MKGHWTSVVETAVMLVGMIMSVEGASPHSC